MKNLKIYIFKIGVVIKGIKKIGFKIIGVLNRIGLFILNNIGIVEVWLIVFICFDFVKKVNMNVRISVVFVLFKVVIKYWIFWERIYGVCLLFW